MWLRARLELLALLVLAAVLNLWSLSINGWANTYYSAAVRSMTTSWHDFLFASLDHSGLMTVDKPPLSLWIQALSARVFGFHPLALLIPQALMGIGAVAIVYDLVRRRFGRVAGFAAGLVMATTPVAVAVSRHNNPDELLALCSVAAVWCVVRGLECGRTRWLVLAGICVGLGFETKMAEALLVVPGLAAAWLWVRPRVRPLRQLLAGGAAMALVGGAWPLAVTLTPASERPWISGTSDNSIWSLIFGYNGLGRISGQSGGPQAFAGGGTLFGGPTGIFRLLQSGLGDQAGWLLGFGLVSGAALLVITRGRRRDPRTGWLIAVGGAFLTIAFLFSFAGGIFHPYYVALLAPFTAALVGAGVGEMLGRDRQARVLGPLALLGGAVTELVVLGELGGQLGWARVLVMALVLPAAAVLALISSHTRAREALLVIALLALLAAPATWAAATVGHRANPTFPLGGPASVDLGAPGPGGGRPGAGAPFGGGATPLAGRPPGGVGAGPPPGLLGAGGGVPRGAGPPSNGFGAPGGSGGSGGGPPGGFGEQTTGLRAAIRYASAHGGGTIAVASQSSAAQAILSSDASVAGIGGFTGRESSVSVSWLAQEVRGGRLRWVIADQGGGPPGDTRRGSSTAIRAVIRACRAVTLSTSTLYDCQGRAAALQGG